eukprot:m.200512 g.200512  ORF g.200512 m.200512 type:complete len:84 (+) comp32771_c0_seq2:6518-6769(+)
MIEASTMMVSVDGIFANMDPAMVGFVGGGGRKEVDKPRVRRSFPTIVELQFLAPTPSANLDHTPLLNLRSYCPRPPSPFKTRR